MMKDEKKMNKGYASVQRIDYVNVYIICPYCGKKHKHSARRGSGWSGARIPHCTSSVNRKNNYIIQPLNDEIFVIEGNRDINKFHVVRYKNCLTRQGSNSWKLYYASISEKMTHEKMNNAQIFHGPIEEK